MIKETKVDIAESIAIRLLSIDAVKLNPTEPFTWASGWESPIYCDNKKICSYPDERRLIKSIFIAAINREFPKKDFGIAAVTGAISMSTMIAHDLNLPMVYVKKEKKGHGLQNFIEGDLSTSKSKKWLVIEDLISIGGSSINAIHAIRKQGGKVIGMMATFTYGFEKANKAFEEAECPIWTLSNYNALLSVAMDKNMITKEELQTLDQWRKDPENWGK